jgi:hypothetical protein
MAMDAKNSNAALELTESLMQTRIEFGTGLPLF